MTSYYQGYNPYCFNTTNDNWTPKIVLDLPDRGYTSNIIISSNATYNSSIQGDAGLLPVYFHNIWKISIPKLILHTGDQYIFAIEHSTNPYWKITGNSTADLVSDNSESVTLPVKPFTLYGMWKGRWTNTIYLADQSSGATEPKDGSVVGIHTNAGAGISTIKTHSGKSILINKDLVPSIKIDNSAGIIVLIYDAKSDQWSQVARTNS